MILYWIAQHVGAVVAGGLCYGIFGYTTLAVSIPNHITQAEAYYMETLLGFFFFATVLNVSKRAQVLGAQAALAVGLVLIAAKGTIQELTGGSFNPVASLGPAVYKGGESLHVLWIYYAAAFTASTLAALLSILFKFVPPAAASGMAHGKDAKDDDEEEGEDDEEEGEDDEEEGGDEDEDEEDKEDEDEEDE